MHYCRLNIIYFQVKESYSTNRFIFAGLLQHRAPLKEEIIIFDTDSEKFQMFPRRFLYDIFVFLLFNETNHNFHRSIPEVPSLCSEDRQINSLIIVEKVRYLMQMISSKVRFCYAVHINVKY